jgi:phosphoserine aminotransferase
LPFYFFLLHSETVLDYLLVIGGSMVELSKQLQQILMSRIHNFSAGPATLPLKVLEQARDELVDFHGAGASLMELSHRGPEYTAVDAQARERLMRLLALDDNFEVLFLQGGASGQFVQVPQNFLHADATADYLCTGTWSQKAIAEARLFGNVNVAYSSESSQFDRVPEDHDIQLSTNPCYVHFTSNNTIFGTQYRSEPATGNYPLVCDASSDFLSRPIDIMRYGLLYAGAQKNAGPAGVTIIIIRKDFLALAKNKGIPEFHQYKNHAGTLYNTPPVFPVYLLNLVLGWLEDQGGVAAIEKINEAKAGRLYAEIDRDDFYRCPAQVNSRSRMNVVFHLPDPTLEKRFLNDAEIAGLSGLKGHRSAGGCRASIYNACPETSVDALIAFMHDFRSKNG